MLLASVSGWGHPVCQHAEVEEAKPYLVGTWMRGPQWMLFSDDGWWELIQFADEGEGAIIDKGWWKIVMGELGDFWIAIQSTDLRCISMMALTRYSDMDGWLYVVGISGRQTWRKFTPR